MALPINIDDLLSKQKVESNRIEFKAGWNPASIYHSICAFANDIDNLGGGYILVGVEEENGVAVRPVKGLEDNQLDKIQREMLQFNAMMDPIYYPRISVEEIDERKILVIWVTSGHNRPYTAPADVTAKLKKPVFYIRYGTSSIEAKGENLDRLRDMANRVPYDDRGNEDISVDDISPLLVKAHLASIGSKLAKADFTSDMEKILEQMELLDGPKEKRLVKNVAAMMFAERPEKFSDKKEVYWFDYSCIESEDEKCINIERFGEHYSIEKDILKPYFKPTKASEKGMNTYSVLSTDKKIIFPYDTKGKLIDMDTMQKKYPGALKYLLDCYDRLVPRCLNNGVGRDVPDATTDTWYKYGRTQALTAFVNTPKLIVRILSKEPMYAYDKDDMLIASGGTAGYCAISELEDKEYDLEYIQAWLAHPYTEKYFQMQGSDFENGFTARGTFLLKKLPFIKLNFSDAKQKKLYDDVVLKTRKIYALNEQMIKRPDKASVRVLEKEKNRIIVEIQDLIGKVYRQEI